MRQLIIIAIILSALGGPGPTQPQEPLIAIEQSWLADGHAGKADEIEHGRKCWRVEPMDFHGQQIWPAWRCVILEGPATGTIQWEWRNP